MDSILNDAIKQIKDAITQQLSTEKHLNKKGVATLSIEKQSIEKQLYANGFRRESSWANRDYYSKNGFKIVEHCGKIYRYNEEHPSGYGKPMNMDELNIEYNHWAENRKGYLLHELNKLK